MSGPTLWVMCIIQNGFSGTPSNALSSTHEGLCEGARSACMGAGKHPGPLSMSTEMRTWLCAQDFDLKIDLEESLQKLQDSKPRRAHFNEPLEALTLEDFSSLFN